MRVYTVTNDAVENYFNYSKNVLRVNKIYCPTRIYRHRRHRRFLMFHQRFFSYNIRRTESMYVYIYL